VRTVFEGPRVPAADITSLDADRHSLVRAGDCLGPRLCPRVRGSRRLPQVVEGHRLGLGNHGPRTSRTGPCTCDGAGSDAPRSPTGAGYGHLLSGARVASGRAVFSPRARAKTPLVVGSHLVQRVPRLRAPT